VCLSGPRGTASGENTNYERLDMADLHARALDAELYISGHSRELRQLVDEYTLVAGDRLPLANIKFNSVATNTFGNAFVTLPYAQRLGPVDVDVVTSAWHMARTEFVFQSALERYVVTRPDLDWSGIALHFVPAPIRTTPEFAEAQSDLEAAKLRMDHEHITTWRETNVVPVFLKNSFAVPSYF
jgi:hypothetical protein